MEQEIDDVNKTAILRLVKKMFLGAIKMRFQLPSNGGAWKSMRERQEGN